MRSAEARAFPWAAVLAATAAAAALRLPGLLQDPWIDEVWSWALARTRESAADVFTLRSSNSHALNTLWIYFVGERPDFVLYRLPAFLTGLACVPLAARIAGRHGRPAAIAAAWLTAVSFLLVVYASEARGYAPLVFFSLAAFECAWTWLDTGAPRWLALSWACAGLGVLSQSLFVVGWGGIALAVAVRVAREAQPRRLARCAAFAGPSLVAFAAWWLVNMRHVFNAGAPHWSTLDMLANTASSAFGAPEGHLAAGLAALLAAAVLALDARWLAARGDAAWAAQLGVVGLGSAATVVLLRGEFLAERYFLVPLVFWLLAFARVLARLAERAPAAAAALFLAFGAGNALHLWPALRVGHGTIGALVRSMAAASASNPIVVTGNYDFNVRTLLDWHARSLPPGRALRYVPQQGLPRAGADFAVIQGPVESAPAAIRIGEQRYALFGSSRHAGPSGESWAVYRREAGGGP
jgi:hypothetical protein